MANGHIVQGGTTGQYLNPPTDAGPSGEAGLGIVGSLFDRDWDTVRHGKQGASKETLLACDKEDTHGDTSPETVDVESQVGLANKKDSRALPNANSLEHALDTERYLESERQQSAKMNPSNWNAQLMEREREFLRNNPGFKSSITGL